MYEPDLQRIVIVAAVDHPVDTWALKEAAQINFDQSDEVPQHDLLEAVLDLVQPAPIEFEERRSQVDWGATGLYVQELLLSYAAGAAAGLTIEGIVAGVRELYLFRPCWNWELGGSSDSRRGSSQVPTRA